MPTSAKSVTARPLTRHKQTVRRTGSTPLAFRATDDGDAPILSYQVVCTSPNGVTGSQQAFSSPISVTGLTNADPYTCTVTATNNVGTGLASTSSGPVVTLPTVPGAPTITSVAAGLRAVTLAFTATNDGDAPILSYRVACTSPNGVLGSHDAPTSPITVAGLTNAQPYTCTVTATNNIGRGPTSTTSGPVVTLPTVPGAPTITSTTAGPHRVTVAFAGPANDGGAPILTYRVACTSKNGVPGSHDAPTSPITVAGLTNAQPYTCTVTATNNIGTGPASMSSNPVSPRSS